MLCPGNSGSIGEPVSRLRKPSWNHSIPGFVMGSVPFRFLLYTCNAYGFPAVPPLILRRRNLDARLQSQGVGQLSARALCPDYDAEEPSLVRLGKFCRPASPSRAIPVSRAAQTANPILG